LITGKSGFVRKTYFLSFRSENGNFAAARIIAIMHCTCSKIGLSGEHITVFGLTKHIFIYLIYNFYTLVMQMFWNLHTIIPWQRPSTLDSGQMSDYISIAYSDFHCKHKLNAFTALSLTWTTCAQEPVSCLLLLYLIHRNTGGSMSMG
jgi:hypothetical protein